MVNESQLIEREQEKERERERNKKGARCKQDLI
jgi:hypothetical protein